MKNIKIVYQYDGSCFQGSQKQKDKKTVSNTIEEILKKSFNEEVNMINAGRTDRGVHAKMQVSNFYFSKNINLDKIKNAINKYSNGEIKVLRVEEVEEEFNSRYNINIRTYEYILSNKENITPFNRKYITSIDYDINVEKFNDILKDYVGKHNFKNFSRSDNKSNKNPNRHILKCYSKRKKDKIYIYIVGKSFLKSMVRIMIGTALKIYEGKLEKDFIHKAFDENITIKKKYILEGNGLYLYSLK